MRGGSRGLAMLLLAVLTGCATQGPYQATRLEAPAAWTMPVPEAALATPSDEAWWRQLNDPAIDVLVDAALADSPSIAQAIARVDEARALLGATSAQRMPSVDVNGNATRARSLDTDSPTGGTTLSTQSGVGLGLSWEIDLFGRVRNSVEAGALRLQARDADARAARLALTSQIGDLVLALRACELSMAVQHEDIDSREKTLALTRRRLDTGFVAPIEEARAQSGLATARTTLATRQEACVRNINALVAITGQPRGTVQAVVAMDTQAVSVAQRVTAIPPSPVVQLALPATVLAAHPAVVAAEREAAAAWSEIAVARAERLPRLDLAAALSGQWLRAAGESLSETVWSLGPTLGAPVFDGGRGAANVSAAQARHRAAEANLRLVVRAAAQDVENAMAAIESAAARRRNTLDAVSAAQRVLDATQARWNVGAVSLFEVEDARRQLAAAQDSAIAAAHDSSRAWIALVRASGHASAATAGGALS
ncbi:efflux transporter outer membrane subunit [Luteimonas sp. XNQY3]|nr:efflux transporter outer membrane subunit [Luteimonas sp. XNQY3]MCD9004972.1 efflux transporter outer membrane subunit [Luteimonas sp. XNQY3]